MHEQLPEFGINKCIINALMKPLQDTKIMHDYKQTSCILNALYAEIK